MRSRVSSYRGRSHQAGTTSIGAHEREDLAMRNRAREREQRAVTAKERQGIGERDEGLLQDVVGLVGRGAERIRDEAADTSGVAIEKLVCRGLIARLKA